MSQNIFYNNVDLNLQEELNARGRAGFYDRSTKSLDFMLGKIANVEITAYTTGSADPNKIVPGPHGILGGRTVQQGRYLPDGPDGFLNDRKTYVETSVDFYKTSRDTPSREDELRGTAPVPGRAFNKETQYTDSSRRIGPYISSVDISVGDHSMGLLNKATVQIVIPNPQRDLDGMEEVWFYPGRYIQLRIVHPESAVITKKTLQDETIVPDSGSLQKLYPNVKVSDLVNKFGKMNVFNFEGLITSFEFSYTTDGTIEATLSITGTSNVYTDVSLYFKKTEDPETKTKTFDANTVEIKPITGSTQPTAAGAAPASNVDPNATPVIEFYGVLYNRVLDLIKQHEIKYQIPERECSVLIPFSVAADNTSQFATDRFILAGEQYLPKEKLTFVYDSSSAVSESVQLEEFNKKVQKQQSETNYNRYITLGGLIHYINTNLLNKIQGSAETATIIHDDKFVFSNYYPNLVSCIPEDVLFMPEDPGGTLGDVSNKYGQVRYYQYVKTDQLYNTNEWTWPGISENTEYSQKIFTSRIFINLETIQKIVNDLSSKGTSKFTLNTFLQNIANLVKTASGRAIDLSLVTLPNSSTELIFSDTKYLKDLKKATPTSPPRPVYPYSVPMFANHPNGSIVQEFTFSARLPDSAKNLSYVLNSGPGVSESDIAPYLNYMYNSKNADDVNKAIKRYSDKHLEIIKTLEDTKQRYGQSPYVPENQQALYNALVEYIKYPTDDIRKSQQLTAPMFPWDVDFTIDGINGLRYGDVLKFNGLPTRYQVNTVFSIISITHTVSSDGIWKTQVKCIMRPKIE